MAERTLIIIKPDAVQRHLTGRIISRFEDKGLKIAAAKWMRISRELASTHYEMHSSKPFFGSLVDFLSAGPVMVMVLEAPNVISITRKMLGKTFGYEAEPGTIRGDFGCSKSYNLVHGSDSVESAEREIGLYFKADEIIDYTFEDEKWISGGME